jgi:myo-inositol 2-dehydrogenase/D-chiro-inositol 1-dehydrogenase
MIPIAVLGCGLIGVMPAANIAAHPHARLAGVQDINAAAAEKTAAATGAPVFASPRRIIRCWGSTRFC